MRVKLSVDVDEQTNCSGVDTSLNLPTSSNHTCTITAGVSTTVVPSTTGQDNVSFVAYLGDDFDNLTDDQCTPLRTTSHFPEVLDTYTCYIAPQFSSMFLK